MKSVLTINLIILFLCNIVFADEKVKFVERDRYMFDEYMVNGNFIDFYNNEVKIRKDVKSLGYIDYGNIRCYQFELFHSYTGYNRLAVYVSSENRIIKTFLTHANELAIITEKEEWMRYVHINEGEFVMGSDLLDKPNWCERQMAWCYENLIPSQEFVDDCTPSKETMKTVGIVILITGAVILIIFAGASAVNSAT